MLTFHVDGKEVVERTDAELRQEWYRESVQNFIARARNINAVVAICTEDEAVILTRVFSRETGCPPSYCHYDGRTLSIHTVDGIPGLFEQVALLVTSCGLVYSAIAATPNT